MVVILLINPRGNFPLNDDWVHGHTVKSLIYNNRLDFYEFTGPILIAQTIYGTLISFFTGFSYNFLRLSTLLLSYLSLIILYLILEKNKTPKKINLFICLLMLFNPIFINTSFTFLTDVPFLFFYLFALYHFKKYLDQAQNINLVLALSASFASFFIRQNGILLFASLIIFFILNNKKEIFKKKFLTFTIISVSLSTIGYILFKNKINLSEGQTHLIEQDILKNVLQWLFYSIQYLGLFSLPLLFLNIKIFLQRKNFLFIIVSFILLIIAHIFFNASFPYIQNIINDFGLGPNIEVMAGTPEAVFTSFFKILLSLLSSFGGALLIFTLSTNFKKIVSDNFSKLVLINFILQLGLILSFKSFDRYYLLLLPMIFILVSQFIEENIIPKYFILPTILLVSMSFLTVTLEKNYMDWNRIRSYFYQETIKNKLVYQIDGGYELNGEYSYETMKNMPIDIDLTRPWYINRLFPKNTREFVISFSELPNYQIIAEKSYYNYFLFKNLKIYLLKKTY